MNIRINSVTGFGQISKGNLLIIENGSGVKFLAIARQIINKGKETEEVVLCKSRNDYFIVSMFLNGKSWVKNVSILPEVEITTLTNNMNEFARR